MSWRSYRACLNKNQKNQCSLCPAGFPAAEHGCPALGGTWTHSVPQSAGPSQGLLSHPCLSIALFGWLHSLHFFKYDKISRFLKKSKKNKCVTLQDLAKAFFFFLNSNKQKKQKNRKNI